MQSFYSDYPFYTHVKTQHYEKILAILRNMGMSKNDWDLQWQGLHFVTVYFKHQHNLTWFLLQGK